MIQKKSDHEIILIQLNSKFYIRIQQLQMNRQNICLGVGQCGIRVSAGFYARIQREHHLNKSHIDLPKIINTKKEIFYQSPQNNNPEAYFQYVYKNTSNPTYIPRWIIADYDTTQIQQIMGGTSGVVPKLQNCISVNKSTGNNFALGWKDQAQISINIIDSIRREVQSCDYFESLQIFHSIGGGTGSSVSSKVMAYFQDHYPNRLLGNFVIIPSPSVSDIVTQPYNAVLALHQLKQLSTFTLILSNDSLYKRAKLFSINKPTYKIINNYIEQIISDCTLPIRFHDNDSTSTSFRKVLTNMTPFRDFHFFGFSMGGFDCRGQNKPKKNSWSFKSFMQMYSPLNSLSGAEKPGRFICISNIIRSNQSRGQLYNLMELARLKNLKLNKYLIKKKYKYVQWNSNFLMNYSTCLRKYGEQAQNSNFNCQDSTISMLYNNSNISDPLRVLLQSSQTLSRRKAFIHHYQVEGMSMQQITQAQSEVQQLASNYNDYEPDYADFGCQQGDDDWDEQQQEEG